MFVKRHQVSGAATVQLLFPLLLFPLLLLLLLLLLIQTTLTVGSLQLISLKNVTVPIASSSLPGNSSQDLMLTMLGPPSNLLCAEATPMLPLKAVLDMAAAKAVIKAKEALIVAVKCALLVGLAWPERGFAPMCADVAVQWALRCCCVEGWARKTANERNVRTRSETNSD